MEMNGDDKHVGLGQVSSMLEGLCVRTWRENRVVMCEGAHIYGF